MLTKLVVIAVFVGILGSLGSALVFLIRDRGRGDRTVKALSLRIGISLGFFALLFVLWGLGLIQPHGIRP